MLKLSIFNKINNKNVCHYANKCFAAHNHACFNFDAISKPEEECNAAHLMSEHLNDKTYQEFHSHFEFY